MTDHLSELRATAEMDDGPLGFWTRREKATVQRLLAALEAAEPLFNELQRTVEAWHKYLDRPRHPDPLRVSTVTTAGTVYAITDALAALKAAGDD